MRSRPSRSAALLATVLSLALLLPVAAAVAQSPFNPLPSSPTTTQTVTPTVTTNSTDTGGLSDSVALIGVIIGIIVVTLIGVFIARDARRRAPKRGTDPFHSQEVTPDMHQGGHKAKQRQRAKARAAKQARRRNR